MDRKPQRATKLCSEILNLHLQAGTGRERELKANLEEIWPTGAIFWIDRQIREFTSLWFLGGGVKFRGQVVAQTLLGGFGCLIEMRFHPSCKWSERKYHPKYLFNPLVLLADRIFETTLYARQTLPAGPRPVAFARTAAMSSFKAASGG